MPIWPMEWARTLFSVNKFDSTHQKQRSPGSANLRRHWQEELNQKVICPQEIIRPFYKQVLHTLVGNTSSQSQKSLCTQPTSKPNFQPCSYKGQDLVESFLHGHSLSASLKPPAWAITEHLPEAFSTENFFAMGFCRSSYWHWENLMRFLCPTSLTTNMPSSEMHV